MSEIVLNLLITEGNDNILQPVQKLGTQYKIKSVSDTKLVIVQSGQKP